MSSNRVSPWLKAVVGTITVGLLMTGCGGTRQSDAAIQQAAGVSAASAAPAAPAGFTGDAGTSAAGAPAPVADAGAAAVPDAASVRAGIEGTAGAANAPSLATTSATRPASSAGVSDTTTTKATGKQAQSATAGAAAVTKQAGAATKKSLIKLGVVGTFSGPVGGLVKDTVTGIRAWSQAVNAVGGINGHPIQVLVGDDGGDPARFNSVLQQFVEQQGVLAILFTTLSFAPNGNNKYLDSKKIYTFGVDGGLEVPYADPYVLSPAPSGFSYADVMILSFGNGIHAQNAVKLASFACSDFGLCDNFDKRWSDKNVLQKAGFTLVARGRPSLTQPDYTSQCLAAKQAGATAIILALDGAAIRRFAGDCARQNYHPKLASADLVITKDLPGDKNVDGLIIGTKMAPFPDVRIPGIKDAVDAFTRFAPGQTPTGGMAYGYLIGQFFAEAGKNLPDNPTQADLANGLYSIKNDDMNGMTYPITMTRGQPMARQLCYGTALIQGGKFVAPPGPSFKCANGGKPMRNVDDYGATGSAADVGDAQPGMAEQGAVMRAALRKGTRAGQSHADASSDEPHVAGFARPRAKVVALPVRASRYRLTSGNTYRPKRVVGLSYLLDALQTGSAAGPGAFYGVALAVLGNPAPPPLDTYQGQLLAQAAAGVEKFSKDAPAAIQASRAYFEALAPYNQYGDAFLDASAGALDASADNYGAFVQPGDSSMRQLADSLRDAKVDACTGSAEI